MIRRIVNSLYHRYNHCPRVGQWFATSNGHVLRVCLVSTESQKVVCELSAAGGMPVSRLKSVTHFEDEDWARFSQGVGRMTGSNIWMVDQANLPLMRYAQQRNTT